MDNYKILPCLAQRIALVVIVVLCSANTSRAANDYADLVALFENWREFEQPPLRDSVPDYTAVRFERSYEDFGKLRARLDAIDPTDWAIEQQVDWHIVRAEMKGFDFNYRVLKPWVRDPAFYQTIWTYRSDVPAHEGPTNHAVLELWTYEFPLSDDEAQRMTRELNVIPPLIQQAMINLTGNARDLWVAGIENFKTQKADLEDLADTVAGTASDQLLQAIAAALAATDEFIRWLQQEARSKTGPSGLGKENYTWYQQNVHYVPLTWEQEVNLLQRELDRAWSSLRLEEHRNRDLPPLVKVTSAEEYDRLADESAAKLIAFLRDNDVMPVKDNMEPAIRENLWEFAPEGERDFFVITMHYDPTPQYTHWYHWFDLAQMRDEPHTSPIRRGPLLYNIFDSRSEGTSTGVEEMFMHAGLYDDNRRVREIVWIMLAQRAARGLGSLYAHANEMTMAEASTVHVEWTPRGWMGTDNDLLRFEQHLYLRQPGYGTSYVTGKYLLERLIRERSKQMDEQGKEFVLSDFFAEYNEAGSIPISLIRWQLTGFDDEIRMMTSD